MPLSDGTQTFEDLVTLLQNTKNPSTLVHQMHAFAAGFADLGKRLQHIELEHIDHLTRLTHLEAQQNTFETQLDGYRHDRDTYKRAVDTAVQAPTANAKRIEDLEKRVRTVEGAVGSTTFKPQKPASGIPTASETVVPHDKSEEMRREDKPHPTIAETLGFKPTGLAPEASA